MRLADYTNRFFDFLADNLRRLAEFLGVKPTENDFGDENSSPSADWLERTKDIPPEQWIDFSSEGGDESTAILTEAKQDIEKVLDLKKTNRHSKAEARSDTIFKKPAPPKPKSGSRYLSFKPSDRSQNRSAESPEPSTGASLESSAESETLSAAPKRKFRLQPSSPILAKKAKTLASPASPAEISDKKEFELSKTVPPFEQRKSVKTKPSVSPQSRNVDERENQVNRPVCQEEFQLETFSRGDFNKPALESVFKLPKQKMPTDFISIPKAKNTAEKLGHVRALKNSVSTASENVIAEHSRRNDDTDDRSVFVTSPWIDLPDEFSPEVIEEITTSRSEAEHLLYLEREQAGNI